MNRPSFRNGLALGVLGGAAVAVAKALQGRRAAATPAVPAPSTEWPPLVDIPPAPEATFDAAPDPAAGVPAPISPQPEVVLPVAKAGSPSAARTVKGAPAPARAKKATAPRKAAIRKAAIMRAPMAAAWVKPTDGTCPGTHPVKAKLSSMIFHLPGMVAYDRTNPDRCYIDAAAAEADDLRPAKR